MATKRVLLDTGPLAALFNPADRAHVRAKTWFAGCDAVMVTTEAVITELATLLNDSTPMQVTALAWVEEARRHGHLEVHAVRDYTEPADLLERYANLPCDYADATLIALANALDLREISTLDERDFSVYRLNRNRVFKLVFPSA